MKYFLSLFFVFFTFASALPAALEAQGGSDLAKRQILVDTGSRLALPSEKFTVKGGVEWKFAYYHKANFTKDPVEIADMDAEYGPDSISVLLTHNKQTLELATGLKAKHNWYNTTFSYAPSSKTTYSLVVIEHQRVVPNANGGYITNPVKASVSSVTIT